MNSMKTALEELKALAEKWVAWAMEEKDTAKKKLCWARAESFAHAACLVNGGIAPIYTKVRKARSK